MTSGETRRAGRAIERAVERLELDLRDLTIYTEAGTGLFAWTASLAAAAGADEVIALARPFGALTAAEVSADARHLAGALGFGSRVNVVTSRSTADLGRAHVVTNLGFVRPIDRELIEALGPAAAVPFMREAWEWRDGEFDVDACRERGIPVFGTDEHDPQVGVFAACGHLAIKMLTEAGFDTAGGERCVVFSPDRFGPTIVEALVGIGIDVELALTGEQAADRLRDAGALVVADFNGPMRVAETAAINSAGLRRMTPGSVVIAFAGGVDAGLVEACGHRCWPIEGSRPGRMGLTLSHVGPGAVLRLHGAGLKVGAASSRGRARGLAGQQLFEYVAERAPAQQIPVFQ